jgi:soluble lytic murein transglycosylase-like protein
MWYRLAVDPNENSNNYTKEQINQKINQIASSKGVRVDVLKAMFFTESSMNQNTPPSNKGALGLGQVMPDTAKDYNKKHPNHILDINDTLENIELAGDKLAHSLKTWKTYALAVPAYNCGDGTIRDWMNGNISDLPTESINYVNKLANLIDTGHSNMPISYKTAKLIRQAGWCFYNQERKLNNYQKRLAQWFETNFH